MDLLFRLPTGDGVCTQICLILNKCFCQLCSYSKNISASVTIFSGPQKNAFVLVGITLNQTSCGSQSSYLSHFTTSHNLIINVHKGGWQDRYCWGCINGPEARLYGCVWGGNLGWVVLLWVHLLWVTEGLWPLVCTLLTSDPVALQDCCLLLQQWEYKHEHTPIKASTAQPQ